MKHAVEIILTLSATFKGSADQQSIDVKTDFAFLGHDNLFSQIYITWLSLKIKREGRNLTKKKKEEISLLLRLLHSSAVMLVNSDIAYCYIAVIATALILMHDFEH